MHMADALISPAVGGTMLAASGVVLSYSISKIKNDMDEKKVPLMGVMGAFVFAAQMINFTIPGTGSSGHIAGGMLLSALLGPYAGFLTLASILFIQALFFADGGLLALGCNIFNMGFFACFFAYPLIYNRIMRKGYSNKRLWIATVLSSVIGLQLGAFSVTVQTLLSGKTELPFLTFVSLMQPIHLAIGLVEGMVTTAVIGFIYKASPELLYKSPVKDFKSGTSYKKVIALLAIAAVITGVFLSQYASKNPDGLEWSTNKITGNTELPIQGGIHKFFADIQEKTALFPNYSIKKGTQNQGYKPNTIDSSSNSRAISAFIGGAITLLIVTATGFILKFYNRRRKKPIA